MRKITCVFLGISLLTAVPALCCCMNTAKAVTSSYSNDPTVKKQSPCHQDRTTESTHQGASDKGASKGHCQCEQPRLIGDFANPLVVYFSGLQVPFYGFLHDLKAAALSEIMTDEFSSAVRGIGPPRHVPFSSAPLYLQISALRI